MSTPRIEITVDSPLWATLDDPKDVARSAVAAAVAQYGEGPERDAEVSVLFCNDAFIATLNERWRGIAKPTNVLSFPADDPSGTLLGDVIVAFETSAREAEAEGKSLRDHVSHLLVHGTLHLLDFDHDDEAEAEAMEAAERAVLATLGVADPYAGADLVDAIR